MKTSIVILLSLLLTLTLDAQTNKKNSTPPAKSEKTQLSGGTFQRKNTNTSTNTSTNTPANTNTSTAPAPESWAQVVGAQIESTGYTIEVKNTSATTATNLNVQVFKGTCANNQFRAAGGVVVPSLDAGQSTSVRIDQTAGWNTGCDTLKIDVMQISKIVGTRAFSIPTF